jgi:hypothetical protein
LVKMFYDEVTKPYYGIFLRLLEDLMRGPDLELVARRLWWEQLWAIIMQVWKGGAVALELVMLEIVRRSGIQRGVQGHMGDPRMRWGDGDEPHPANPLAILAPGFYNRAAGPWRAPRRAGRRNQPDHPQHGQLFYEAAGFPLRRRGDIHPADLAAAVPPAPDAIQQGNEQQDENGQQDGGRRRKTRRKKRRKRRRRRGGQPSRMTRGVQRQAKKIHKPQKPLRASAREFVPERDGNTGYDKEVSNADEWGRNIKPYPQSHMQSGHEEIARREARRAEARRAEAREAHEAAWPTPAENAASRAKPVGGRKTRRKTRKRRGGVIERMNPSPPTVVRRGWQAMTARRPGDPAPFVGPLPANPILLKLNEIIDIINECHPNGCPQVQRPKSAMKRGGPPRAAGSARGGRRRRKSRKKRGGKWISVQQGDKNIVEFLNLYINQRIKFKFSDPPEWFTPTTPSIAAAPGWADRVFEGTLGKAFTFEAIGRVESVAFSIMVGQGHSIFFTTTFAGLADTAFEFFQFNQPPKSARKIPHH